MVTAFSLSISSYLSTEENGRKGNFILFWGNLGIWLNSVAWGGLIIHWRFSYSCPGYCYSHVIETFLHVKTNERDQRPQCSSACWSVTGNTAASGGGHRACEQEIIGLWSKKYYPSLYLKNTGLVPDGNIHRSVHLCGVLKRLFSQTLYKKGLVENGLNTCRAQERRRYFVNLLGDFHEAASPALCLKRRVINRIREELLRQKRKGGGNLKGWFRFSR